MVPETIAYAADGYEVILGRPEFLGEVGDLHVYAPLRDDVVVAVEGIHDLVSGEDHARVFRQCNEFRGARSVVQTLVAKWHRPLAKFLYRLSPRLLPAGCRYAGSAIGG